LSNIALAENSVLFTPHPDPLSSRGEGKIKDKNSMGERLQNISDGPRSIEGRLPGLLKNPVGSI
jgi:hypothetical protein